MPCFITVLSSTLYLSICHALLYSTVIHTLSWYMPCYITVLSSTLYLSICHALSQYCHPHFIVACHPYSYIPHQSTAFFVKLMLLMSIICCWRKIYKIITNIFGFTETACLTNSSVAIYNTVTMDLLKS